MEKKTPVMTSHEDLAEMLTKQYLAGFKDGLTTASTALNNSQTELMPQGETIQQEILVKLKSITVAAPVPPAPEASTASEETEVASTPATPTPESDSSPS